MKTEKIVIIGAGVAGATLAHLLCKNAHNTCSLNSSRVEINIYDMTRVYSKPCGEAIPVKTLSLIQEKNLEKPRVLNEINSFIISSDKFSKELNYKHPLWLIIDKAEWINRLRRSFEECLIVKTQRRLSSFQNSSIIFDARGPFASPANTIPVWQAYADFHWNKDEVFLYFDLRRGGLVWVFPYRDLVNIGGGFLDLNNPKHFSLEKIEFFLKQKPKILKERYSIITIDPIIKLFDNNTIRLGEAAGLIMPLGGEGIRPALASAIAAHNSISICDHGKGILFSKKKYYAQLKNLISQIKFQKVLLKISRKYSGIAEKLLEKSDERILASWFQGFLAKRDVMKSILRILT